ncbi:formin-2-like, partial [Manacus candei]|uniref:formin-2-like n=1 Tax=Manacus candei TaxID=415023 RepID=UPI0022280455
SPPLSQHWDPPPTPFPVLGPPFSSTGTPPPAPELGALPVLGLTPPGPSTGRPPPHGLGPHLLPPPPSALGPLPALGSPLPCTGTPFIALPPPSPPALGTTPPFPTTAPPPQGCWGGVWHLGGVQGGAIMGCFTPPWGGTSLGRGYFRGGFHDMVPPALHGRWCQTHPLILGGCDPLPVLPVLPQTILGGAHSHPPQPCQSPVWVQDPPPKNPEALQAVLEVGGKEWGGQAIPPPPWSPPSKSSIGQVPVQRAAPPQTPGGSQSPPSTPGGSPIPPPSPVCVLSQHCDPRPPPPSARPGPPSSQIPPPPPTRDHFNMKEFFFFVSVVLGFFLFFFFFCFFLIFFFFFFFP